MAKYSLTRSNHWIEFYFNNISHYRVSINNGHFSINFQHSTSEQDGLERRWQSNDNLLGTTLSGVARNKLFQLTLRLPVLLLPFRGMCTLYTGCVRTCQVGCCVGTCMCVCSGEKKTIADWMSNWDSPRILISDWIEVSFTTNINWEHYFRWQLSVNLIGWCCSFYEK